MGCLCDNKETREKNISFNSFNAYKELESTIKNINEKEIIKDKEVFLIKSNSIKNFIALIEDAFKNNNEEENDEIKNKFSSYKLETNIEIISDYQEFIKLKEEEKKIIVVNENFLKNMNMKNFKKKNVLLNKNKNGLKIKFATSLEEAGIEKFNNYSFKLFELPNTQISKNK